MLIFNVKRVLDLRGIDKPYAFLHHNGFVRSTSGNLVNGNVWEIKLRHIEKLCLLLNCTPNDLFEWRADKDAPPVSETHALKSLKREKDVPRISEIVKDMPIEKMVEISEMLNRMKSEESDK